MPPTTTLANGFWACEPMPVAMAAGNNPMAAPKVAMRIGRN